MRRVVMTCKCFKSGYDDLQLFRARCMTCTRYQLGCDDLPAFSDRPWRPDCVSLRWPANTLTKIMVTCTYSEPGSGNLHTLWAWQITCERPEPGSDLPSTEGVASVRAPQFYGRPDRQSSNGARPFISWPDFRPQNTSSKLTAVGREFLDYASFVPEVNAFG